MLSSCIEEKKTKEKKNKTKQSNRKSTRKSNRVVHFYVFFSFNNRILRATNNRKKMNKKKTNRFNDKNDKQTLIYCYQMRLRYSISIGENTDDGDVENSM